MRPIGLGLVAALVIGLLTPATGMAQAKGAKPTVSEAQRKQGMTEAPPLVTAAGLPCQVSDARFVGKSPEDKKAGTPASSYYEVACGASMGYIVSAPAGATPTAFTCLEADTPPAPGKPAALPCILPGNADPKAALGVALTQAKIPCDPVSARGIGQSKTATYLEVACQGSVGYVLIASSPFDASKKIEAQNCLNFDDPTGTIHCTLTDRATRLAVVDRYNTDAKTNCAIKDRRYVGTSTEGSTYFEVACQDGKGYIYQINTKGAFASSMECAKAQAMLGGCTLTDARQAATEQAGLYTRLAKAAGSTCDVDHYAVFPTQGTDDVVELSCKDGSGAVGIFKAAGKGEVLDCGHALVAGFKCGLAKPGDGFAYLTADLKKYDKKDCVVSDSRLAGSDPAKGTIYVEVACADHLKGYMVEYKKAPVTAVSATSCALAGGCKLPGNT